ncbi:hypothetical protein BKH46_06525 [Helicobacter sp. 12S02634-8]|uniref:hypothetical protein n=1 Tax=Helicobacter sp. 12S02634-8 TaxID=1476199 RepID=UPI000BA5590B|nr:hypothetical protein [Helicobacter sp. 12S02634-8]PAF46620.1 hypothetical protein BKH46_06525 [Helicobacter sp. 12S02634-8]
MKYLNSTNSVLNFFLVLLAITFASFFFFAPQTSLEISDTKNIPKIELMGFNMYQINKNFVDMKIEGARAVQFSDYEVLYGFLASRYNSQAKNIYEYISGQEVLRKGDLYEFPKGVVYTKSDGGSFWSESGVYDYRNETFKGKGNFMLTALEGNFDGKNIIYNRKTQTISAIDITSEITLDGQKSQDKQASSKRPANPNNQRIQKEGIQ